MTKVKVKIKDKTVFEGTDEEFSEIAEKASRLANTDIKSFMDRALRLESEMDELKEDKKALFEEIKEAGLSKKAFCEAMKIHRKGFDKDLAQTVNLYLEQTGQYSIFKE